MVEKPVSQTPSLDILSELNRRVRLIETKFEQFQEKINFLEKEIISLKNDLKVHYHFAQNKIQEISAKIELLLKEIQDVETSLQDYAKKNEIEKIKTMIEIFNPLKSNFVTKEEIETILKEFKIQKE